jgi:hypothetical protein
MLIKVCMVAQFALQYLHVLSYVLRHLYCRSIVVIY